ncbi:MAG: integrase [Candidatus Aldehydirespiratoraceae bacterium]
MGVKRLDSGRWEASYRDPRQRERTKVFKTRKDAERWRSANLADISRGDWHDPRLARRTLADWVDQWWPTTVNLSPSTRVRDQSYVELYVLADLGDDELGRIGQTDIQAWVAALSTRGLAPATVTKAYQLLAKILSAAVDAGLLASSPCRRITLPAKERKEMRFLTAEEVGWLADTIHPRYRALVLIAAYGGLRIGELAGLRPQRVNLLKSTVDIVEIVVEIRGKITTGPPKTKASRRTITLPRSVTAELEAHLREHSSPQRVFTAPEGGDLRVPSWRRRFWNPAIEEAGLAPLRPHDLRHTAVALWIATGANTLEIARRAGHTSTSFTLDRYGHLFPEADSQLVERLETIYQPPTPPPRAAITSLRPRSNPR